MPKKRLLIITLLGIMFFIPLFIYRNLGPLDFWWWMSLNLIVLLGLVFTFDHGYRKILRQDLLSHPIRKIALGVLSALVLYGVFFAGNYFSRLILPIADEGIQGVYHFKGNADALRIALSMLLIIGPGEELFWRGFLQRNLEPYLGKWGGFALGVIIYTGVHVFTGNLMLIAAALTAGLFWGWMYAKYRSMLMNIVSHTVWDVVVFVVLPFA